MLVLGSASNPVKTYPYLMRGSSTGWSMCFPGRTAQQTYITETYLDNLIFGASEGFTRRPAPSG